MSDLEHTGCRIRFTHLRLALTGPQAAWLAAETAAGRQPLIAGFVFDRDLHISGDVFLDDGRVLDPRGDLHPARRLAAA